MAKKNTNQSETKLEEVVFDAEGLSLGRLCSIAAKSAMMNHNVIILNSEKAVVTGRKALVLEQFKAKIVRGDPTNGPFYPRLPHLMVKRVIRGMIPWKMPRGQAAYRRIKCYIGVPEEFKGRKIAAFGKNFTIIKAQSGAISIGEICQYLGAKF